ncbi:MAG TPA: CoA pyrophosphatase [Clostridiales bacterium]|jgi:mutator protein MutT|nr:CoA pyrophosphatase [Clostridiales bacterium]
MTKETATKDSKAFWSIKDFKERFVDWHPRPIDSHRFYAVLVPLIEADGELSLLYEVRSEGLVNQPGQVCFPGGKIEAGETAAECAVRETCEELNLQPQEISLIGPMDFLHTYRNFTMYPYLGVIRKFDEQPIKPNPDEVKECFTVPFSFFWDSEPLLYQYAIQPQINEDFPYKTLNTEPNYRWRGGVADIPIYRYNEYPIWGLTAQITKRLVEIMREGLE